MPGADPLDGAIKVLRAEPGNRDALEAVYVVMRPWLIRVMQIECRLDYQAAEEIVHDVLVRLLVGPAAPWRYHAGYWDRFESADFRRYGRRACRNCWLDHMKRQERAASGGAEVLDGLPSQAPDPERAATVSELLDRLLGVDAEIAKLYYAEGQKGREIAALLGMTEDAVYQRLNRIRKKFGNRRQDLPS